MEDLLTQLLETQCIISRIRLRKVADRADAIASTDRLEHFAFKRRGAIHCARADEPQYLDKLIDT